MVDWTSSLRNSRLNHLSMICYCSSISKDVCQHCQGRDQETILGLVYSGSKLYNPFISYAQHSISAPAKCLHYTYELHFRGGLFILRTKAFLVYGQKSVPVKHLIVIYWKNMLDWTPLFGGRRRFDFCLAGIPCTVCLLNIEKKSCLQINLRWQNSLLLALVWCVVMNGLVLEFNGLYWYVKWTVFPPITLCACVRTARYRLSRRLPVTKDGHKFLTLLKHQWIEHRYSVIESIQPIFSPKHNLRSLILSYEITTI